MRIALLVLLIFIYSCGNTQLTSLPEYDREQDCSEKSKTFWNNNSSNRKTRQYSSAKSSSLMKLVAREVKHCYQEEVNTGYKGSHNLCLISRINKKGRLDYFAFSAERSILPEFLKRCLNDIKHKDFWNNIHLSNVIINQPFRLYPRL